MTNWEQTKYAGETTFDGDGRAAKVTSLQSQRTGSTWSSWAGGSNYSIFSSVTGQKVSALEPNGALQKNHIYVGDTQLMENGPGLVDSYRLTDPVVGSTRDVQSSGAFFAGDEATTRNESSGLGMSIPHVQPTTMPFPDYAGGKSNLGSAGEGCTHGGGPISCDQAYRILQRFGLYTEYGGILQMDVTRISGRLVYDNEDVAANQRANQGSRTQRVGNRGIIFPDDDPDFVIIGVGFSWVNPGVESKRFPQTVAKTGSLPCPPTGGQLAKNSLVRNRLVSLFEKESGHRTDAPLENGGWIYQYTSGRSKGLFFFEPAEFWRRGSNSIDLTNAPRIRNARVVADVHTHPYKPSQQDNVNNLEGQGKTLDLPNSDFGPYWKDQATGPSNLDARTATLFPSLVVYESVSKFGVDSTRSIFIASVGVDRLAQRGCP